MVLGVVNCNYVSTWFYKLLSRYNTNIFEKMFGIICKQLEQLACFKQKAIL